MKCRKELTKSERDRIWFVKFYGRTTNKEKLLKRIIGRSVDMAWAGGIFGEPIKDGSLKWMSVSMKKMITQDLRKAGVLPLR